MSLTEFTDKFESEMEDDLNTANAVSVLFEMSKVINLNVSEKTSKASIKVILEKFLSLANVLGLLTKKDALVDEDIENLITQRQTARRNKDYARSDEIRMILREKGIILEDTKEGVKWKRV
jgi:cysteinyl-tRNA synthetase